MPKESPTTSSLWAGPQNPRSGAGQAAAVPTQPWLGALVSSPPGIPVPRHRGPQAGRAQPGTGPGNRCCPRSCERVGTAARHLPPQDEVFGGAPGAATVAGTRQHSAWDLGTRWHLVPDLKPTGSRGGPRGEGGTPAGLEEEGEGRLWGGSGGLWQWWSKAQAGVGPPLRGAQPCQDAALWFQLGFWVGNTRKELERPSPAGDGAPCHSRHRRRATSLLPPPPAWWHSQHPAPSAQHPAPRALPPRRDWDFGQAVPTPPTPSPSPSHDGEGTKLKKGTCG